MIRSQHLLSSGQQLVARKRFTLVVTELTPSLRVGEFCAHVGQKGLVFERLRMRTTEDPAPPLKHVLYDGLGFEQVVAWVETVASTPRRVDSRAGRHGCTQGCPRGLRLSSG